MGPARGGNAAAAAAAVANQRRKNNAAAAAAANRRRDNEGIILIPSSSRHSAGSVSILVPSSSKDNDNDVSSSRHRTQQQVQERSFESNATTAQQSNPDTANDKDKDDDNASTLSSYRPKTWRDVFGSIKNFRFFCGYIINNTIVQGMLIGLIILNSILMGMSTYDFIDNSVQLSHIGNKIDSAFLIIFTIELGFQFVYHGLHLFLDGWLFFDTVIIMLSWFLEGLSIVRSFRIFRAMRLLNRLRSIRSLINAMLDVLPSLSAIVALLLLVMYIYAVLCTTLFGDLYIKGVTEVDYFSRLDTSLFTLLQMMTLEWADIVRVVSTEYAYAWAIFATFLIFTSFVLYSLIVAVVCDAVAVNEHSEDTEKEKEVANDIHLRMKLINQRITDISHQQATILQYMSKSTIISDTTNEPSTNRNPQLLIQRRQQHHHSNTPDTSSSIQKKLSFSITELRAQPSYESSQHQRRRSSDIDLDEYISVAGSSSDVGTTNNNNNNDTVGDSNHRRRRHYMDDDEDAYLSVASNNDKENNNDNTTNRRRSQQRPQLSRRTSQSFQSIRNFQNAKTSVVINNYNDEFFMKQEDRLITLRKQILHSSSNRRKQLRTNQERNRQ